MLTVSFELTLALVPRVKEFLLIIQNPSFIKEQAALKTAGWSVEDQNQQLTDLIPFRKFCFTTPVAKKHVFFFLLSMPTCKLS